MDLDDPLTITTFFISIGKHFSIYLILSGVNAVFIGNSEVLFPQVVIVIRCWKGVYHQCSLLKYSIEIQGGNHKACFVLTKKEYEKVGLTM